MTCELEADEPLDVPRLPRLRHRLLRYGRPDVSEHPSFFF
jgi:hypothetical protein